MNNNATINNAMINNAAINNDSINNKVTTNHDVNFTDWPWLHWAESDPEQIALVYGEQQFTWQQVNELVNEHAKQLTDQGVGEGHIIAAVSTNNLPVLWLYLACLRLGACCVILDPKQTTEQLNGKLETLAAAFIWLAGSELKVLVNLDDEDAKQLVFTYSEKPLIVGTSPLSDVKWQAQRLASIVFTSGSSGKAKAVAHNAENHLYSAAGLLQSFVYTAQDSWLLSLPLFHVSGLAIVWRWLFAGGQLVLPATTNIVEQLSTVTHASLVPTQLKRYLHELDTAIDKEQAKNAISLKRILLGGAVIPIVLTDKAKSLGIECWSGYGMTEMASTVTAKRADSSAGVGQLLAHRSLDIDGQSIKVRGASLGIGYYYRGTLRSMTDDNGWLVTGDLGESKCEGVLVDTSFDKSSSELFILGRSDNMFISGGENIHPEHIERILLSHPLINQALVFPYEDAEFGHRPIAVIDAMAHISVCEMNNYLQYKLAKFMWPLNYYTLPNNISVSGIKLNRASVQIWFASLSK